MCLVVNSVKKKIGSRQILDDIYLTCNKGEIIGLLGRNGSGKSTLLKIIFGSLSAQSKHVKVNDKRINNVYDGKDLLKYLPQKDFLPNHISINKIISFFLFDQKREIFMNHEVIRPILNKKCIDLSKGERRLFEILLIINANAEYVLLDEPFNWLSPIIKELVKKEINKETLYKGFIVTDHDYRNIFDVSSRLLLLHNGCTKEIKQKEELKAWGYVKN